LVRHQELVDISVTNLFTEVEKRGMESIHFPIKDKWIPHSMPKLIDLVEVIISRLKDRKSVVVHCNGGKGRSGTLLVATLVGLGKKVDNAIKVVRRTRSGTIKNPVQIAYLRLFKKAWKKNREKSQTKQESLENSISDDEILDPQEEELWEEYEKSKSRFNLEKLDMDVKTEEDEEQ